MKVLVTGINGQVGHALMQQIGGHELIGLTRKECDLTKFDQIKQAIDYHEPNLIINAAACTNVDLAQEDPDLAFKINSDAPRVMAEKAYECKIPFIHFSTDYVFDGKKEGAYIETDLTNPLSVYGQSKLSGEKGIQAIDGQFYIFRTSWVYSNQGRNFFLTMKKLIGERNEISVVSDQFGIPTSNYFIAQEMSKIIKLLLPHNKGIYHLVPNGKCSWFDFVQLIARKIDSDFDLNNLNPISTIDHVTNAIRPKNSVLDNHKAQSTFMIELNHWETELDRIINET